MIHIAEKVMQQPDLKVNVTYYTGIAIENYLSFGWESVLRIDFPKGAFLEHECPKIFQYDVSMSTD